jgi:hypothetical protein
MRIRRRRVNTFAVVGLTVVVLSLPLFIGLALDAPARPGGSKGHAH